MWHGRLWYSLRGKVRLVSTLLAFPIRKLVLLLCCNRQIGNFMTVGVVVPVMMIQVAVGLRQGIYCGENDQK